MFGRVINTPMLLALRKMCPYSEFYLSMFSRIRTEYEEIGSIFPYLVRLRKNTDQRNSEYRHLSGNVVDKLKTN